MPPTQSTTRSGIVHMAAVKLEQIDRANKRLRTMWAEHGELMRQLDGDDFAEYRRRTASIDVATQAEAITAGDGMIPAPEPLDVRPPDDDGDFEQRFWHVSDDDSRVLAWLREHLHIGAGAGLGVDDPVVTE